MFASKITGSFGPVEFLPDETVQGATEQQLKEIESETGLRLPDDYRDYLTTLNGGKVTPRGLAYRYSDEDKKVLEQVLSPSDEVLTDCIAIVRSFYSSAHEIENRDILRAQIHVAAWGRPGLLGIAVTSFGDFIVLDLNEGDFYGSVHYLTLQGVAGLDETGDQVPLGYIAPNFTAMTQMFLDYDSVIDARVQAHLAQKK